MNLYDVTVPHFTKSLANLETWIDKAHELAKAKSFDANVLLQQRLAVDMFPLVRQIQTVCDHAKFVCARTTGKEAPAHPDTETTWDEIRTRIRSVRELVASFEPGDFEGAEQRRVTLSFIPGKVLLGKDYVLEMGRPNFDFHLAMVYAILRQSGVDLGKRAFIGSLNFQDA